MMVYKPKCNTIAQHYINNTPMYRSTTTTILLLLLLFLCKDHDVHKKCHTTIAQGYIRGLL